MASSVKQYIWTARFFSILYLSLALMGSYIVVYGPPAKLLESQQLPIPTEPKHLFWFMLTIALMAVLFLTTLWSSFFPKAKGYFLIHFAAKILSAAGFVYLFLKQEKYAFYLLTANIELFIGVFFLALFLRAYFSHTSLKSSDQPVTLS